MEDNPPNVQNQSAVVPDPYYTTEPSRRSFFGKKGIIIAVILLVFFIILAIGIFAFSRIQRGDEANREVSLTYWGLWENQNVMQPIFDEFHRQNPNITIQYEKQDIVSLGNYIERLRERSKNETGPDIIKFHNSWLPQVKDLLLPFPEDLVKSADIENSYVETVSNDLRQDGAYYGLPLGVDTLALFVNLQLLNNIGATTPTTWEDLVKVSRELTVIEDGKIQTAGVALGTYDNIAHASDIISLLLIQNGADLNNLEGNTKENAKDALEFYTSFSQGEGRVWDQTLTNSKTAFAGGRLALYFGYSWDIFEIQTINPNLSFQVSPVPTLAGRKNTVSSYWVEGVSSKTKHPREAFVFLDYLSRTGTLQKLFEAQSKVRSFGAAYPRKAMVDLLKNNALVYPFALQADVAMATPFSSDTYDDGMNTELNVYLGNAIRSIINDNTSPGSAVETLGRGATQVLSRYGK